MSRPELEAIDAALRGEEVAAEHADLAALVADVRASAPPLPPALAARLEEIAAPRRRPRWASRRLQAVLAGAVVAAVAAVAVVVVVRPGQHEPVEVLRPAPAGQADQAAPPVGASEAAPARRAPSVAGGTSAGGPRRVERDASLTLAAATDDFADVSDGVVRTTDRFGGIVQRSTVDQEDAYGRATFDLRIPARRLDDALAALSDLAHVRARSAGTVDVTGAFSAAVERLADARAERRALLRALAAAATAEQTARIRDRLREVRERIGRARRAVAALRRRTDLARVSVSVVAERRAAGGDGGGTWTPGDALRDAWRVLQVAAGVALVALAAAAPLALLGALGVAGARTARRRRREAALRASGA